MKFNFQIFFTIQTVNPGTQRVLSALRQSNGISRGRHHRWYIARRIVYIVLSRFEAIADSGGQQIRRSRWKWKIRLYARHPRDENLVRGSIRVHCEFLIRRLTAANGTWNAIENLIVLIRTRTLFLPRLLLSVWRAADWTSRPQAKCVIQHFRHHRLLQLRRSLPGHANFHHIEKRLQAGKCDGHLGGGLRDNRGRRWTCERRCRVESGER